MNRPGDIRRISSPDWHATRFPAEIALPSRRIFFKRSLLGSLAFFGASIWAEATTRGGALAGSGDLKLFRAKDVALVRIVTLSFLDALLPSLSAERSKALDAAVKTADWYFSALPPLAHGEIRKALDLLHVAPVRWLGGIWGDWDAASVEDMHGFMERCRTSRFELPRKIFFLLEAVATIGWYGQAQSWAGIGYYAAHDIARATGEDPL